MANARSGGPPGGVSIGPMDHNMRVAQTNDCRRQKKNRRQNRALLALMLEHLQARKQAEGQTEQHRANPAKAKSPQHRPLRGIRHGCQKCQDAENQQHRIAAEYQSEIKIKCFHIVHSAA